MRNYIFLTGLLPLIALFAVSSCNTAIPSAAEHDPPPSRLDENADFYGMVRRTFANYQPFKSEQQMRDASDLVVAGRPVDLQGGRTVNAPEGDPAGSHYFVLKIAVKKVIKGSSASEVYVEFPRTLPTSLESLRQALPEQDMVMYLVDTAKYLQHPDPAKRPRVFNEAAGRPSLDTPLYGLNSPQGMIVNTGQGLSQPLTERTYWLIPEEQRVTSPPVVSPGDADKSGESKMPTSLQHRH